MVGHAHHSRAFREIEDRRDRGETLVVAAPALVEAYSVMTRLPPPETLSPATAGNLLRTNFLDSDAKLVALSATEYSRVIIDAPQQVVSGGRVYDAVIVACAISAAVQVILTFNERHFRPLARDGVAVVVPA
jgi:predicted nucleic acid-binding protein